MPHNCVTPMLHTSSVRHDEEPTITTTNNPIHHQQKGTTATHHYLTPAQHRFVEETYGALRKIIARKFAKANLYGQQFDDIASFAIEKVIKHVDRYMRSHQSPLHAANAVATNAFIDSIRRELAQRGHGARGTRTVIGDNPLNRDEPGAGSVIDNLSSSIADIDRWVDDEHHQLVIGEVRELIPALAFEGFVLTAINGYTQDEAANMLGVTRTHLNKVMKKATRLIMSHGISYEQWGVN